MSRLIHASIAVLAATAFGAAIAQSTPPDPNAANPAVGAGQQSSQATPMGTTGTQAGGGTAASGTMSTGTTNSGTVGSSTDTGSSQSMGSSTDTTTASASSTRAARADRN